MPGRIEKTVFISYRRTNLAWARAIYQDLTTHGYDAFFDFQSINSGDFSQLLMENIKARAHFVLLLTPSALERCDNPSDWLRREIETAIDFKRNIIPVMLENFDFGSPSNINNLTGKLALLKDYNGLRIHSDYFEEAMERLRQRYLNIPLDAVIHPLSEPVKIITVQHQAAANRTPLPEIEDAAFRIFHTAIKEPTEPTSNLSWITNPIRSTQVSFYLRRAKKLTEDGKFEEAIKDYNEIIKINPDHDKAYLERGLIFLLINNLGNAIRDFSKAIQSNPNESDAYYGRGFCRQLTRNYERAIKDYSESIRIKPDDPRPHNSLGNIYSILGNITNAFSSYQRAISLSPYEGTFRASMVRVLYKLDRPQEAFEYEQLARSLMQNENEYNKACLEAVCGNLEESLNLLKSAFDKGEVNLLWAQQDPDLENIQNEPRFRALVGL